VIYSGSCQLFNECNILFCCSKTIFYYLHISAKISITHSTKV